MTERFVLRDEVFGGTLYDRKLLRHLFLTEEEIRGGIIVGDTLIQGFEHWRADTRNIPSEIIFSPIRVYYEGTKQCPLRCDTCFNSSGEKSENEMDTKTVMRTLEGMRADNVLDLRCTGGEFTVKPDWDEILRYAKELGFAVSLNTNCVYRDGRIIDQLAALDLGQVTTSVDGTRETHDSIRGKGTYDQTLNTLQELHQKGVVLRTNTVLTQRNIREMEAVIEAVGPFVSEMNFFHMRPTGRGAQIIKEAVTYEELATFNRQAADVVRRYPGINIMFGSYVARINSIRLNELGLTCGGPDGFTRFNLMDDGSLYAGGYAPYISESLRLGNIVDEAFTLLRIWRNSAKLRQFREFSKRLTERCMNCPELTVSCGGTNVEMELISLFTPGFKNPYCKYSV